MSEVTRVTLVIPKELWEEVKRIAPSGGRSRLVAEALETEIRLRKRLTQLEQLNQHQKYMRNKYGEFPTSVDDITKMRRERDGEIESMR
jgi:metal-responsive CopG/Arc/MetJ family transcriptional regulator